MLDMHNHHCEKKEKKPYIYLIHLHDLANNFFLKKAIIKSIHLVGPSSRGDSMWTHEVEFPTRYEFLATFL